MPSEKMPKITAHIPNTPVVFYCKDCKKIVKCKRILGKNKFKFKCIECSKKNIAFGTEKSIKNYYRITDRKDAVNKNPSPETNKKEHRTTSATSPKKQ